MSKKILLVGPEQPLWAEFRLFCETSESGWHLEFVRTGLECLAILSRQNFDVVVADVQLLDMNGADLLDDLMRQHPGIARIVISDVAEPQRTVCCVGRPHRHLLKQCGAQMLFEAVNQAATRESWMPDKALQNLVAQMRTIPSPPAIYFEVVGEIQSEHASVERIGELISQDPAITAKVLQLSNSVVFGLQLQVTRPAEAIAYLGMETTRALVLLAHTFSSFKKSRLKDFSFESLWHHSVFTGRFARQIVQLENSRPDQAEQAAASGLLHDLGKLLFAANLPVEFAKALWIAREEKCDLWQAERSVFGATHADLGACLLRIWGLPSAVVQSVALHHNPSQLQDQAFGPVTAVHAADVIAHEAWPEAPGISAPAMDLEYLRQLGLEAHADLWRRRCLPQAEAFSA